MLSIIKGKNKTTINAENQFALVQTLIPRLGRISPEYTQQIGPIEITNKAKYISITKKGKT